MVGGTTVSRTFAVRATILVAAAAGFFYAFTSAASAKVVEPGSAYQPTSVQLAKMAVDASKPGTNPFTAPSQPPKAEITKPQPAPATPAPEQVVSVRPQSPDVVTVRSDASPLQRAVRPLRNGVVKVGSYLERVVSSCPVGAGPVTGGPVMVFAVLCFGLALERRRVLAARPATDEVARELLYARELTPPG
jgi:hypothetical protein